MPKLDGFVCENGCGQTLSVPTGESIGRHGWYTTFTPTGEPTIYACSARCLRIVAERLEGATRNHLRTGAS